VLVGEDEPRPFKAYLDVGLRRTSTGNRVFGAMKGASDGGIFIPETKTIDAETLQKYIVGGHVAEYMESLEEEDDERFKKQFSTYLAEDIGSEDIEELYTSAYAAIREDPEFKPTEKDVAKWKAESQKLRQPKLNREQRRERVEQKIAAYKAGRAGAEEEEEEDDE
jgi:large subunit ribosomal protein L5e